MSSPNDGRNVGDVFCDRFASGLGIKNYDTPSLASQHTARSKGIDVITLPDSPSGLLS